MIHETQAKELVLFLPLIRYTLDMNVWEQCKFQETKFVISYAKELWVSLTSLFEKDTKEKYVYFFMLLCVLNSFPT